MAIPLTWVQADTRINLMNTQKITTVRLALQGAILGVAIVGLFTQVPHSDIVGAIIGGVAVYVAKLKHFF